MKKSIALVLIAVAWGCATKNESTSAISPDSEYIRITGRVKNDKDSVTIYWSGTTVMAKFSGTELRAELRDERGDNYFNIVIDGDSLRYIKLDTVKKYYTLASGLPVGEHTVELVKRNEWDRGQTWFYGLEIINGRMVPLPSKKNRTIEFFGNSITAGYAIEDNTGGDSPDSIYTNNYYTYAALTARHFNANYYCTVKSGIGIMVSWFPLIMPEMYNRLDPNDSTSLWDFKKVTPDVVVINLFQNDSWLVQKPEHPSFSLRFGTKPPSEEETIEAYRSFVHKIRTVYPTAHIICALGSMDATREGSPWPGYVQQAVRELQDVKIYTHFFPFTKKEGHPRTADNAEMAKSLINFIDKNITW
jgi:hypothetical protein